MYVLLYLIKLGTCSESVEVTSFVRKSNDYLECFDYVLDTRQEVVVQERQIEGQSKAL